MDHRNNCPDCPGWPSTPVTRRQFVGHVGAVAAATSAVSVPPTAFARPAGKPRKPETLVAKLYRSLSLRQKAAICHPWDYKDDRGLLRMHVNNNWHINKVRIASPFFTADQQEMIEAIFFGLYQPEWRDRIRKQLKDDAGGYGRSQNIAIFGTPGTGKFEFVMTGRHLTIRCDGDSTENVAFGGPIFYGHAARGFNETKNHPGNVFWYQALKANGLYKMLDGRHRRQALVAEAPEESRVLFRGAKGRFDGLPVSELAKDQKAELQKVLAALTEPYRTTDRNEVNKCLKAQGGLDKCHLAFYQSDDIGDDRVWDIWRLEGPAFVWHYRGAPHVHVWVNVASDPAVKITAG